MRSLTRYLLRQVLGPLAFVTLTLTGVIWLTQSLRYVERMITQGWTLDWFLYVAVLLLPGVLAVVLPVALFCATLYAYQRLTTDSELVVFSAVGYGRAALVRPILGLALAVAVVLYGLTLYLMPLGARTFRATQVEFTSQFAAFLIREGVFNTPLPGITVYVRERAPNGELLGILVHDNRNGLRPITMMAERGALIKGPDVPLFTMVNGNRQQVDADRSSLSLLYFDSYTLELNQSSGATAAAWREPNERYLDELLWPELTSADDRNNRNQLVAEGHRRLSTPLLAPALALVALATVLAGPYNRRGTNRRLMAGAGIAVLMQIAAFAAAHGASKAPALIALFYLNPLLFAAGAVAILARGQRPVAAPAAVEAA
jgi:lipopolysaccharide export system permease protein